MKKSKKKLHKKAVVQSPKLRYISVRTLKNKKRVTEYVIVKSYLIRYRDSKNKIVKFDARKKLRVEVQFEMSNGTIRWKQNSTSYGLPLRRRKRPISDKIIQTQMRKKHALKLGRGHIIVSEVGEMNNLVSWTYYYQSKTKAEKAAQRKKRRRGLKRERLKTLKNKM